NTALSVANDAKKRAETAQGTANSALANAQASLKASEFVSGGTSGEEANTFRIVATECPGGQSVTGGGYTLTGERRKITVTSEGSAFYGPGWLVTAEAINGQGTPTWGMSVVAVCAHP